DLAHLELVFVHNADFRLKNGVSVLKARPHIRGEFFLMMSDHIVDRAVYRTLQGEPARDGLVLAVDYKLSTIFDMDDATKVRVGPRNTIAEIGKEIPHFDAVDTGVFRCAEVLFEHLEAVFAQRGDVSLSDGVQALASTGKARVADVGDAWWQDVDTPETKVHGEEVLLGLLARDDDGPVSRLVNRKLSRPITAALMNTRIQPLHVTLACLAVGLTAATLVATASGVWALALGGLLYQLASVLRGVDGELARLRLQDSDGGAWLDTVTDDVANLAFQVAVGLGVTRLTGDPVWLVISLATVAAGLLLCGNLYFALRALGLGSHRALDWRFRDDDEGAFQRFCARFAFLAGRDVQAALLMLLAFMGVAGLEVGLVLGFLVVAGVSGQYISTRVRAAARGQARPSARAEG
ncbi:MAG: CDP-alcohol phosphatidyltransferase family protein, partial [bacterium]